MHGFFFGFKILDFLHILTSISIGLILSTPIFVVFFLVFTKLYLEGRGGDSRDIPILSLLASTLIALGGIYSSFIRWYVGGFRKLIQERYIDVVGVHSSKLGFSYIARLEIVTFYFLSISACGLFFYLVVGEKWKLLKKWL